MRTRLERKSKTRQDRLITEETAGFVFRDDATRRLKIGCKPLAETDILGALVREAAWFFAQEVRIPNSNELYEEVSDLYRLANRALCAIEANGREARLPSTGANTLPMKTGIAEVFEALAIAR